MNAFILSSSYDRSNNNHLNNKINMRIKDKINPKVSNNIKNFQELKKQLSAFKQKMFSESKFNYFNLSNKCKDHKSIEPKQHKHSNLNSINEQDISINQQEENINKNIKKRKISLLSHKLTEQSLEDPKISCHKKKEKHRERISMNAMELKILRKVKGSHQSLITINNTTLPLKIKDNPKSRKFVKSEVKQGCPIPYEEKNDLNSQSDQYECRIKAQQLMDLVRQQQIKQYNKRCLDRLSNEKNKAIYNQAIFKIYQLAKQKLHSKQKYEIPKQLGINKIVIPKRVEKQELIRKTKDIVPNYERKRMELQREMQKKSQKRPQKLKRKDQPSRNQTQCLSYRDYREDFGNEYKINGWQFDIQNSKQFIL